MLEDSVIDGNVQSNISVDIDDDIPESEDFSETTVLVMWTSLLQLLCKCRKSGCGAQVLPDNMRPVRNGKFGFTD
jgi:hypothetical protein